MRCDCCNRVINPLNAVRWTMHHELHDGAKTARQMIYGPICAVKHGVTKPAQKLKRKPSRFAVFNTVAKQNDFQEDFFQGIA